jgi:NADH-quinone oxidoreductase subunit E
LILSELTNRLGIGPGETTEDNEFTLEAVNCVGACAMAPVVIVGEKYWGSAKPVRVPKYLEVDGGDDDEN